VELVDLELRRNLKIEVGTVLVAKRLDRRVRMKPLVRMTYPCLQPEHSQKSFHPAAPE